MSYRLNRHGLAWAAGLALGAAPGLVLAAGFYIQEQSVSGLGRAFAGESAIAADASTIYFNPAGMTRLEAPEFQVAVHLLVPTARVTDKGSTFNGAPYTGGSGGNPYDPTPVPNLFYARPVNERTWLGFGLTAPFGLANGYDKDFFARYDSSRNSLKVIDLQPSIAYQLNDHVSIGGGINIQYADATLENALVDPLGPSLDTDGKFTLEGDSWDYGFNIGLLADLNADTRLGIHYRQGIVHTLKGTARTRYPTNVPFVGGQTVVEDGEAKLKLPDIVSLGLSHRFSERWTGLVQYTWFNWSNFDEIAVKLEDSTDPAPVRQNYRNSWALALGADYVLNERWTLRGGIQYDVTPTQDGYRTTRTPDGDRTWFSVGASYERDQRLGFDFAYTYIDVAKEPLDLTRNAGTGDVVMRGTTDGNVHILAAALRYRF
jgi:long-chain fatty acid transport protein